MMQKKVQQDTSSVFDDLSGGLLITGADAKILYANESFVAPTGYAVAEVIGKNPRDLWGGHMSQAFYENLWKEISVKKKPFVQKFHNETKKHRSIEQENHIAPVLNSEGNVELYVEIEQRDTKNKSEFTKEFVELFSGGTPSMRDFSHWYYRWKGGSFDFFSIAGSLHELLYKQAIRPLQDRFASRYDDQTLVEEAKKDSGKFAALYEKYYDDIVYYFTPRVSGDSVLAADLAQDTFLRAFSYFENFRITNASYKTYLFRIAHNILVNYYRRQKTLSLESFDQIGDIITLPFEYSIFENLQSMQFLSETEKNVLILKYHEGFSCKEIAQMIGKSENAVKLSLSRARKKMRADMEN